MCNNTIYFLRRQKNLIYFLTTNILREEFLIVQVQVIVTIVFVQVHISDETFLVLIVTIPEKSYLMCSPISSLSGCLSELRQNRYCS